MRISIDEAVHLRHRKTLYYYSQCGKIPFFLLCAATPVTTAPTYHHLYSLVLPVSPILGPLA